MTKNVFLPALHTILDDFRGFDEAFNSLYNSNEIRKVSRCNVEEDDKNYLIEMDMPGVKKEDLEIGIKENILSVSAKRKKMMKSENGESKEEVISSYEQSFNISTKGIDVENIEANLNNGVLTITLPKKEEVKYEKKINIA
ncbi:Hsp20/alpha crystallin family protein [uncultured Brachyspira sp.]|uniref:Hsp20/alpha crystallin family protein n=1 Tax=uncultured Brachyspira sp. TaxID=221953 RepID=UPI00262699A6|nr:Hsp20/alpha crystallin family protein [uncultured Brachyspira sp.]